MNAMEIWQWSFTAAMFSVFSQCVLFTRDYDYCLTEHWLAF